MPKTKFNAKTAGEFDNLDALSDVGMHVEQPTFGGGSSHNDDLTQAPNGRPNFSQLKTVQKQPIARDPLVNVSPDKNLQEDERHEEITVDPQEYEKRKGALEERAKKNPFAQANLKRFKQNISDRFQIAGTYAYIDRTAREAFPCPTCGGAKNGGNELMPPERKSEQKYCPGCANTGHTLFSPELDTHNIHDYAAKHNRVIQIHEDYCKPAACHPQCIANKPAAPGELGVIDQERMKAKREGRKLTKEVTHNRSGSNDIIKNHLMPMAVVDDYKAPAKSLHALGGREDQPIQKFDTVHFLNHDTSNPNSDITKDERQEMFDAYHPSQWGGPRRFDLKQETKAQEVTDKDFGKIPILQHPMNDESASIKGPKDKQATGIIERVSKDGKYADVNVSYTPIEVQRKERYERTNGREDRNMIYDSAESLNASTPRGMPNPDKNPGIEQDNNDHISKVTAFKRHINNAWNTIRPMMGELSPVRGRTRTVLKNVPISHVARISPVTAAMVATVGHANAVVKRSTINPDFKGQDSTRVNVVYRKGLGISEDEIKNDILTTPNNAARRSLKRIAKDADKLRGVKPGHPDALTPLVKGEQKSPEIKNQRNMPRGEQQKFNSGVFNFPEADLKFPVAEVPGELDDDWLKGLTKVAESHIGKKLTDEEKQTATEGFKETKNVNGGLKKLGYDTGEDDDEALF